MIAPQEAVVAAEVISSVIMSSFEVGVLYGKAVKSR
jgi:hypothetical protein